MQKGYNISNPQVHPDSARRVQSAEWADRWRHPHGEARRLQPLPAEEERSLVRQLCSTNNQISNLAANVLSNEKLIGVGLMHSRFVWIPIMSWQR